MKIAWVLPIVLHLTTVSCLQNQKTKPQHNSLFFQTLPVGPRERFCRLERLKEWVKEDSAVNDWIQHKLAEISLLSEIIPADRNMTFVASGRSKDRHLFFPDFGLYFKVNTVLVAKFKENSAQSLNEKRITQLKTSFLATCLNGPGIVSFGRFEDDLEIFKTQLKTDGRAVGYYTMTREKFPNERKFSWKDDLENSSKPFQRLLNENSRVPRNIANTLFALKRLGVAPLDFQVLISDSGEVAPFDTEFWKLGAPAQFQNSLRGFLKFLTRSTHTFEPFLEKLETAFHETSEELYRDFCGAVQPTKAESEHSQPPLYVCRKH